MKSGTDVGQEGQGGLACSAFVHLRVGLRSGLCALSKSTLALWTLFTSHHNILGREFTILQHIKTHREVPTFGEDPHMCMCLLEFTVFDSLVMSHNLI